MDNYRQKVNKIKAPETLIRATLNKIHTEQEQPQPSPAQNSPRKIIPFRKSKILLSIASVAAAAILVITLGMGHFAAPATNIVYNTVPDGIIRTLPDNESNESMSVQDYSDYLGLDICQLTKNASLTKATIAVRYDDKDIIYDECAAYYDVNNVPIMIRFSKTTSTIPDALYGGEPSLVNGVTVLAAVSENGQSYTAALEQNGISICLFSSRTDRQTFEQFLVDLINTCFS